MTSNPQLEQLLKQQNELKQTIKQHDDELQQLQRTISELQQKERALQAEQYLRIQSLQNIESQIRTLENKQNELNRVQSNTQQQTEIRNVDTKKEQSTQESKETHVNTSNVLRDEIDDVSNDVGRREEERLLRALSKKKTNTPIKKTVTEPKKDELSLLKKQQEEERKRQQEEAKKKQLEERKKKELEALEEKKNREDTERRASSAENSQQNAPNELLEELKKKEGTVVEFCWPHSFDITAKVFLLGSFTNWKEVPMTRDDSHLFKVSLPLSRGTHLFRFKVDGVIKHDNKQPCGFDERGNMCNKITV